MHRAGVIHRDIKPSNIILAADPESGEQPKLIDFGVAKVRMAEPEDQLTRAGQLVGSPHYMSPEQITGGQIDPRSDVYSLGCVLYHTLAGRPPFDGAEEFNILTQHVRRAPPPLPDDVPAPLAALVTRALAKDPAARFASMDQMAAALSAAAAALAASDAQARSFRTLVAAPPPQRRRAPLAALGATAAVALALGVGLGAWVQRGAAVADTGLLIATEPPGATVELDGRRLDQPSPLAVTRIAPGAHELVLRHPHHGVVERHVTLRPRERQLVEVVLPPRSHSVAVKTAPSDAAVYLDGRLVIGTTPTVMSVLDDDFHEIRIERAGYETLTHVLKPEDHEPELLLELVPEKRRTGSIAVDANGAGEVWLDGVSTGYITPTLAFQVPVGEHTLELRGAGGLRSPPTRLAVRQGQTVHLTMAFSGASAPPNGTPRAGRPEPPAPATP